MTERTRHCPDCGSDQEFEQHHARNDSCPDTPDRYCPEWICTACRAGLLIGSVSYLYFPPQARQLRDRVA